MKKNIKKFTAIILSFILVLQMFLVSDLQLKASETSVSAGVTYTNKDTGVLYVYYEDISQYREEENYTYEVKEGYVFGGWWTGVTEAADDAVATPVSEKTVYGGAWAKYVPEEVLTVKAQVSKRVAEVTDNNTEVKLRLVTSVDSLRYRRVGFKVFVTKENDMHTQDVFSEVTVREDASNSTKVYPKDIFHKTASSHFATRVISGFTKDMFNSKELRVTPYWKTLDGTIVEGETRNRLLVSDDLASEADGSGDDFTVKDGTYTYMTEVSSDNKASYQYFVGASDTIYLKGKYTTVGEENKFGISIRNGGVTRNVFFEGYGSRVYDGEDANMSDSEGIKEYTWHQTNVNGAYVWQQGINSSNADNSYVAKMLETEGTYDIIWAIANNTLYCSMGAENEASEALFMIPMTELCADWKDGRYYQLGVAGYNSESIANSMKFVVDTLEFGQTVYTDSLLIKEAEKLHTSDVAYVPIGGTYVPSSEYQPYTSSLCSKVLHTPFVDADTPIGIEGTAKQCLNDWTTYVGVTVTLKKEDGTTQSVEYFPAPDSGSFASANLVGNNGANWTDFKSPTSRTVNEGDNKIKAAIYDGKLSVLFNDVTEYEIALTDLFAKWELSYTGTEFVSVGLAMCHDKAEINVTQLPKFIDVKTYEGQKAIDMKMADWSFYPESVNEYITYDVKTGSIDDANDNYGHLVLQGESDVWEVSGTLSHDANDDAWAYHGFGIVSGDAGVRIFGRNSGFIADTQCAAGADSNQQWHDWEGANYLIRTTEASSFFGSKEAAGPISFKVVIAYDMFYMWLDGKLAWIAPLKTLNANITTSNYQFAFTGNWADARYNDVVVRTGSEIDVEFLTTLKTALDMDWLRANTLRTLNSDGEITVLNTDGGDIASCVYSSKASNAIYMSGTWTKEFDVADYFGIVLSDGENVRQINLHEQGFMMMAGNTWSGDDSWMWKYNFAGTDGVVFGQLDSAKLEKTSAIENMLTGSKKSHDIEWAVYENDLYCSVDGQISFIVPLEEICHLWTEDVATPLYVGINDYQPAYGKYTNVSNLKIAYGTEAVEKLSAGKTEELTEFSNVLYDAIHGAYISKAIEGSAAAYGAASEAVGLQAQIAWYDMKTTDGVAGISVKASNGKSIEFMAFSPDAKIRKLENLVWEQWEDITLTSGKAPFNGKGLCNLQAYVKDDHLYIRYDDVLAYDVALSEYLDDYTEGLTYQLGIATNNSDKGIAYFSDINYFSGAEVDALASKISLGDPSDVWEVTGVMKQSDLTQLVSQGFEIRGINTEEKETVLTLYGKNGGFTANDTEYHYTATGERYVVNESVNYYNFFRVDGNRSNESISFRLRLVEDTLSVWFDDILAWNIPLTEEAFGAFKADSDYELLLATAGVNAQDMFENWSVAQGTEVPVLVNIDETSTSTAELNEMTGAVVRTGDYAETVFMEGVSDTWELTGIMEKGNDNIASIPHGFTVRDASSGNTWRFYGQDNNVTVASWDSWNTYSDNRYVLNENAWEHFGVAGQKNLVYFRLALREDVLYLWLDDVLTWRLPLTATEFGAFESGSVYQIGVAVNGGTSDDSNDDGTISYKNLIANNGNEADTANTTKFVATSSTDGVAADTESGKLIINGSTNVDTVYFASNEENNRSDKWEVTGTIRRADINAGSMIGFKVSDGTNEAGYWFADGDGMMVGVGYPWNYYGTDVEGIAYNEATSNFGQRINEQDEITFRAVILDDVFYVYFEDQLTWKLNLTNDNFGYTESVSDDWSSQTLKGFAAGSTYRLGFTNVDAATVYYENLTVKSGNAVLTQEDFFIRDPFVLADNGVYYMYGTRYDGSFDVFTSVDLMVWKKQGQCFVPEDDFWGGTTNFWAPEVYKYTYNGETAYYMFATFLSSETVAKDESLNMSYDNEGVRGTAVLKAESPLGPFKEYSDGALTLEAHDCLDGTLYVDDNGTPYMIYAHEHTCGACHQGFVREGEINYVQLSPDLKTTVGEHIEWFGANDYDSVEPDTLLTDGPFVYTFGTQKYLLWTTSEDGVDGSYIQLATAFSTIGDVTGSSVKDNSQVLYGSDIPGGHAMVFKGFDRKEYMILHTPNTGEVRSKIFTITVQDGEWKVEQKVD